LKPHEPRKPWTIPLTYQEADQLTEVYFIMEGDRRKMGQALGFPASVPPHLMVNPEVRRMIAAKARHGRTNVYSREEHIAQLQEIRDRCLADENWKTALASEIAVGKAAGLYENVGAGSEEDAALIAGNKPVDQLTNEQIRQRLAKIQNIAGSQDALPSPKPAPVETADQTGPF
jgi:hypothetical protein